MNGSTSTPAAVSCAISASTIVFSPDGWASRYRLCATTTFMDRKPLTPRGRGYRWRRARTTGGRGARGLPARARGRPPRRAARGRRDQRPEDVRPAADRGRRPGRSPTPAGTASSSTSLFEGDLHLVVHLARAGWLHYREAFPSRPRYAGQGPDRAAGTARRRLRLRPDRGRHPEEAGRLPGDRPGRGARGGQAGPGRARRRPGHASPSGCASRRGQLKGVLTDQAVLAGVGNAYSDEILHAREAVPVRDHRPAHRRRRSPRLYAATRQVLGDAVDAVGRPAGRGAEGREALRAEGARAAPGCPARSAGTPCARCRSPTPACSTAPPARPAASRSLTAVVHASYGE